MDHMILGYIFQRMISYRGIILKNIINYVKCYFPFFPKIKVLFFQYFNKSSYSKIDK